MNYPLPFWHRTLLTVLFLTTALQLSAQLKNDGSGHELKTLTPEDYERWEYTLYPTISKDNNWITYEILNLKGDVNVYIESADGSHKKKFTDASSPQLSQKGDWVVMKSVSKSKETEKSEKKASNKYIMYNMRSGDSLYYEDVTQIKFSGQGNYASMLREKDKKRTLIIRKLSDGSELSFGNIRDYEWQEEGDLLAMIIETEDKKSNGIQLYDPKTGSLRALDHKEADYTTLKWIEKSNDLVALRSTENKDYEENSYDILLWKGLGTKSEAQKVFNQQEFKNFPNDSRILNNSLKFSKDASRIYFEITDRTKKPEKEEKASQEETEKDSVNIKKAKKKKTEAPELEIWNSNDRIIIPEQKKRRIQGVNNPVQAVWLISNNSLSTLTDETIESVSLDTEQKFVLGKDGSPYEFEARFGRVKYDIYIINAETGHKQLLLQNIGSFYALSPDGNFFVYLKDDNLFLYNIKEGSSTDLTSSIAASFINTHSDYPLPQKPAYGFGAWDKKSRSCLIYSEFDVWQVFTNGKPTRRITDGEKDQIVYRYFNTDRRIKEEDLNTEITFSMFGKWSKKSGYASAIPGQATKTLIYKDARINLLSLSEDKKHILYKSSTYEDPENLYYADAKFSNSRRLTDLNAFQTEFKWGKAELVNYTNDLGNKAQGILYYPAEYNKGEKYPMITYIYETLSDGLHRYIAPSSADYYNATVWTQNGYFVFMPDIEFEAGNPGVSSARTLEKAVAAVIEKGDVDASKVGLIGHSWGGYQAGFVPTQTNIFAASVAGAGLTNLISMNLAVTPGFGGKPENNHFEIGQERMVVAPWLSPEKYIENSSVMNVHKLNTPILFEVGDNDMNVNWRQGIEYYNAARRAQKPFILLVYANEGHGLREKKNQTDYQQRILKWFGHYLKGEEAEDWITDEIPYPAQQQRLKHWNK